MQYLKSDQLKGVKQKKAKTVIKQKSKTNKNTPAKFAQETKDKILARDKFCIISGGPIEEYHHCFYGPIQANYGPNRNDVDQGVGLSANIHRIIHHPSPAETKKAKEYRIRCINYLLNYV